MKTFINVFLFLSISCFSFAQDSVDNLNLNELDEFINSVIIEWDIPGLALAVVKEGRGIHLKGYGFVDKEKKAPVTEHTLFSIASCSKAFTSTLAGILFDEGKLDVNEPLMKYFPNFKLYDDWVAPKVTMKDFLCHWSGIGRQDLFRTNMPSDRETVMRMIRYMEPDVDFRSQFHYTNFGFTVAGYMMGQLAGMKWEDLITDRLMNPLGMNETIFSVNDLRNKSDYAKPYINWGYGLELL